MGDFGLWQPIDTAPMDGSVVLIYADQGPLSNGIHAASWQQWKDPTLNGYGHCWCIASYQGLGESISGYPSHWMPLPETPSR